MHARLGHMNQGKYTSSGTGRYRYGFNGMEKDDNVKGSGNSYDFGARIQDPRLGRWLAIDPKFERYSPLSPYNFVANTPIIAIDPDGEKIIIVGGRKYRKAVKKVLKDLAKQSSVGRALVTEIINSQNIVVISTNPDGDIGVTGTYTDENGIVKTRLTFNLDEAGNPLNAANGRGDAALEMPSEVTMAHELSHVKDKFDGITHGYVVNPDNPTYEDEDGYLQPNYISVGEVKAVELENKVRAQMKLKLRTHYAGFEVFNKEISKTERKMGGTKGYYLVNKKPVDFSKFAKTNKPLSDNSKLVQQPIEVFWKHSFKEKEDYARHWGFGASKVKAYGEGKASTIISGYQKAKSSAGDPKPK